MKSERIETCGGLVRYRNVYDEHFGDRIEDEYYARGVGWVSYGAARTSWTTKEQDDVRTWRRSVGL